MKALRRGPFDREILRLAVPALATLAADPLLSLVDTAFVGRLGTTPLASLGVAAAVFGIGFAVANFLPYGATPLIASSAGAGDVEEAGRLARGALITAALVGGIGLVVLEVGAVPLSRIMGASGDVIDGTVAYLRIRALSFPALLVVLAAHGIFRGHQDTKTPSIVSIGISALNLVLDPVLIFGFDLGLAGAAWATTTAQWLGAGWLLALMIERREAFYFDQGSGAALKALMLAGGALVVRTLALVAAFAVAVAVAARISTVAVAAHQVAFQIWIFLALVVDALAIAGQARVGVHVGAGDTARARQVSDRLLGMGLIVGVALAAVLGLGSSVIPELFTDDAAVISAVGSIFAFVVLMQPLNALVFVWDGIGIGAGAFRYLAGSMIAAGLVCVAGLALVLPFELGLTGVWWAVLWLMVVRAAALAWWYGHGPLGRRRYPASREA